MNLKLQYRYDEVRASLEKYIKKNGLNETIYKAKKNIPESLSDDKRKNAICYLMWFNVEREIRQPISHSWGVDDTHIVSLMEKICKDMGIYDKF